MSTELQNYMERPKRYENIDGTGEMFFGLMFLGFALAGYLEAGLPENSSRWMHGVAVYACLIPTLGLGFWLRRVIKRHLTWPRTGYVAYPRNRRWWITLVASGFVAIIVVVGFECLMGFARRHDAMSLPQTGMLVLYIALYAFWVFRMNREHSWKWLVLLFMALGLLTITLIVPGDSRQFDQFMLLLVGLAWLISGAGTLFSYIRHTKPATPETE